MSREHVARWAADRLSKRVVRFGRLLRAAGLPIGPARILVGLEALGVVNVTRRDDVFWTLHAAWVRKAEDREKRYERRREKHNTTLPKTPKHKLPYSYICVRNTDVYTHTESCP